jgi:uncharacterized protein (TIGR02757 family)
MKRPGSSKGLNFLRLKEELEFLADKFNTPEFIPVDPISIPHQYKGKEDREISAFLSATIAWGQRPVILRNANRMMALMEFQPHQFLLHSARKDLNRFKNFVHRTFNGVDCVYFMEALRHIYQHEGGLETMFTRAYKHSDGHMGETISQVRTAFFSIRSPGRTAKHFSDPQTGAAAKRINMFLRWMVRRDKRGVDFGLWKNISPADLCCPLDVHSARNAREFGLLNRKQNDWKAVMELTQNLRKLNPEDPVKYDFALYGFGVSGK